MNINETVLKLLKGERVRMSYDNFELLTEYIQNASDELYNMFKGLASDDNTIGTIKVLEAYIKQ